MQGASNWGLISWTNWDKHSAGLSSAVHDPCLVLRVEHATQVLHRGRRHDNAVSCEALSQGVRTPPVYTSHTDSPSGKPPIGIHASNYTMHCIQLPLATSLPTPASLARITLPRLHNSEQILFAYISLIESRRWLLASASRSVLGQTEPRLLLKLNAPCQLL